MKRKMLLVSFIFIICIVIVSLVLRNEIILAFMVQEMISSIREDNEIELLDVQSVCGKLNGGGNGIQYFGAALVRISSEDKLKKLAEKLEEKYEVIGYIKQTDPNIYSGYLEHKKLQFKHADFESEGLYYQVFFYCSYHKYSNLCSITGH